MFIESQAAMIAQSDDFKTTTLLAGGAGHVVCKLAKTPFNPSRTSDPATFTEADFDGYAAQNVAAFSGTYLNKNGDAQTIGTTLLSFTPTGSTTPNTIGGYWLVTSGGVYLGGEVFNPTVGLNGPLTTLDFTIEWATTVAQFGATIVS